MAKEVRSSRTHPRSGPECPPGVRALLIGGGGREHALGWKMAQSPRLEALWLTHPENAGLAPLGKACPVSLDRRDQWRLKKWLNAQAINLIVIGPEAPLAAGLADDLAAPGRAIFGVGRDAARLESDKAWAKQLMRSAAIPTGEGRAFSNHEKAREYLLSREDDLPVIKASGLAAGKGVVIPETMEEAEEALEAMMKQRRFGDAGSTVVIEERLQGSEVSILALVDGRNIYILEPCRDHKRAFDNDEGPNTGGMGAICPARSGLDDQTMQVIEREILVPTLDALRREDIDFRGVLYAGLMLTPGGPKVLEFNCRFGDPECQPLMARMKADLIEVMWATATGRLDEVSIDWDPRSACAVVMASEGYPGAYRTGMEIGGIDDVMHGAGDDLVIFHAGTAMRDGRLVTAGGRVLCVTGLGETLEAARRRALDACGRIHFDGAFYRRDIGANGVRDNVRV